MSKWRKVKLSELGEIVGGATPSTKREDYYNGEIPWLTPKDLSGYSSRYISKGERSITKDGLDSCSAKILPKDSVLFTSRAPIGYVAIAENEICTNQGFKSIVPNKNTDPLFIFYLLKHNKERIEAMGSGTTFKEVSGSVMKNIEVDAPEYEEQKRISAILASIDNLIEQNNQMNKNLEAQAQAIFKSWFVDFEPWGGVMPEDWREGKLGQLCESVSITRSKERSKMIFLNTGDIENGLFMHNNYSVVSNMPGQAKKTIQENDILYSEIRPINKHFAFVNFSAEDYVVSTKLMVIRCKQGYARRIYHYLTQSLLINKLQAEAESRSGTFPQIRFENIKSLAIVLADEQTEKQFADFLAEMYLVIDNNNQQSQTLAALRDTLLPKLMSGEIDVKEEE